MTTRNIYDDPDFFAGYVTLDRQVRGLDGAAEWPVLRSLVPSVVDRRVVDLGCGFGWFSRWAAEHGACHVLGIDGSTKMLERARRNTTSPLVEYRLADLEELELGSGSADIVFSSLSLHYVADLQTLVATIADAVVPGGALVFSVEHPILSAPSTQEFQSSDDGEDVWPLDNYLVEGARVRTWFVDGVVKQHHTMTTYINTVVDAGFALDRIEEWGPSAEQIAARPELARDLHRPWFLLLRATRTGRT